MSTKLRAFSCIECRSFLLFSYHRNECFQLDADVVLVAVGRRPYSRNLGLEELGVALDRVRLSVRGLVSGCLTSGAS